MISVKDGQIELSGAREKVKLELMMLLHHVRESDLFENVSEFEMCVAFASMSEKEQTGIVSEMIDGLIEDLEKYTKKKGK